ncbi:TonB-dependent receptor domain-containing protein [Parahaliea mediterranea]|uniref:TonB-dependent receptor domain-containing protein n=1 Tax=Parahaliea mediterranea TaxID=651086 RepID=UPI000E2E5263|nr:TonB-dependent receptor [Parahaliea mediterranea]
MNKQGKFAALATTSIYAALAGPAVAQNSAAPAIEEVVVTGSRIRSPNAESVSPITTVGAEEFQARGVMRAEDLVNALPQVFAAQGSSASNEATGTAQVDLRGLSPERTLVLVNGRRLPYGSPKSVPSDLNQIPTDLIQNVEVLTGGASAVYGSDAIAGVVNFKLIDDFEGIKFTVNQSTAQHGNDNSTMERLLDENGFAKPDSTVWDGHSQDYSLVMGTNVDDGRGNITVYATYREVDAILQSDRDYSSCALATAGERGEQYACGGSGYSYPANMSNTLGLNGVPTAFGVNNGEFVEGNTVFNYAPFNYYQRPDKRYTFGALANYKINDHVNPYMEMSFMDDRSTAQIAPGTVQGGIYGDLGGLNCDNALLSDQQKDFLCGAAGLSSGSIYDDAGNYVGPEDVAEGILVRRRNLEGGPRQDELRHESFRVVLGTDGKLAGAFNYDLFASYANVSYTSRFTGDANRFRLANALNAVIDQRPGSSTFGQPVCSINADASALNDDAGCLPLDYFGADFASPEATAYVLENKGITGDTSMKNLVFSVNGDLGEYGIKSPWADYGVGVAGGYEYRENTLDYRPDEIYATAVTPELPISGDVSVNEVFAEVNVPLIDGVTMIDMLSLEGAYRYSDYSSGFTTDTFKLGLNWAPVSDLRLRGSFQRAVRAPNVIELFSSQQKFEVDLTQLPNGSFDPCSGANPWASLEQCMRTGVTAAQYGNIQDNPAGQFNTLVGGNQDLNPETANTYSFGLVYSPEMIPGLTVSVDYFDIEVEDLVGSVNPNLAMNNCLETGDSYFCGLINRGQGGSLFLFDDGYFERFNINTGSLETKGFDLTVDYGFDVGNLGDVSVNFVGTLLDEFTSTPLPNSTGDEIYDCTGLYGGLCGRPRPEWRHKMRANWVTPWDLSVALTWRYISSVDIAQTSSQPALSGSFAAVNKTLDERNYLDLSAGYMVNDNITLRAGINNLLDRDPPLTTTAAIEDGGNGNTYPQFYDAVGRTIFMSLTFELF